MCVCVCVCISLKFTPEGGSIEVSAVYDECTKEHSPKELSFENKGKVKATYKGKFKIHVRDTGRFMEFSVHTVRNNLFNSHASCFLSSQGLV